MDPDLVRLIRKINLTNQIISGLIDSGGKGSVVKKKLSVLEDLVADIPLERPDLVEEYTRLLANLWIRLVRRDHAFTVLHQQSPRTMTSFQDQELPKQSQNHSTSSSLSSQLPKLQIKDQVKHCTTLQQDNFLDAKLDGKKVFL